MFTHALAITESHNSVTHKINVHVRGLRTLHGNQHNTIWHAVFSFQQ